MDGFQARPEAPAGNPYWPDASEAAQALIADCVRQLEQWGSAAREENGCPGMGGGPISATSVSTGSTARRGVATWLVRQAADWLRLAQAERLLGYAWLEGQDPAGQDYAGYRAFLAAPGFLQLSRTKRGWTRNPGVPSFGHASQGVRET